MKLDEDRIKSILIEKKFFAPQALEDLQAIARASNIPLIDYLLTSKAISKIRLGEVIGKSLNTGYVDLSFLQISRKQTIKIPKEIAEQFKVILYAEDETTTHVATDDPTQPQLKSVLANIFPDKTIGVVYAFTDDIIKCFANYLPPKSRLSTLLGNPRSQTSDIVDEIVRDALKQKASDVHIEIQEKKALLRFRVDGILHQIATFDRDSHDNIVNRFKIITRLKIDEHRSAQDGAVRLLSDGHTVDLRISVVPTLDGEKIAIRVLSQYIGDLTLYDLGLSEERQKDLIETASKPFGMILITGPTSSGKTTTLYALIKILNKPEVNITTIEDPVEYKIEGVNQIQVDNRAKLSFADGLRSIVRQDPNIILVGEIRDSETIEISVNAALTGHLLLSTFHANDAATAIPRLLDMGVEPFLVASTLQLVIAQRLIRKICPNCKVSETYQRESLINAWPKLRNYFSDEQITLHHGTGCDNCGGTGYKGRMAIYEFIKNTPQLQDLILKNPSSKQIWQIAKDDGTRPLFDEGMDRVKDGTTTVDELLRVATPAEEHIG